MKNKIMVSNPRGLVKWMKPEDFGITSRTRNFLIANLLSKTIYVEKLGTGINRIKKVMSDAKLLKHEFRFNTSFFATLYDKTFLAKDLEKDLEKDIEGLNKNQKNIIFQIQNNKFVTQSELSKIVGINEKNIRNNITKLKQKGLIKRIGSAKGGHWEVITNEK